VISLWENQWRTLDLSNLRDKVDCPTCKHHQFSWLTGKRGSQSAVLCGRNSVQLSFPDREPISLHALAERLRPLGEVKANEFLVKFWYQDYVLTIFADARAIVNGTEDLSVAKKIYTQFVGS
jgi:adenylyltransferase/sulfurtransferase